MSIARLRSLPALGRARSDDDAMPTKPAAARRLAPVQTSPAQPTFRRADSASRDAARRAWPRPTDRLAGKAPSRSPPATGFAAWRAERPAPRSRPARCESLPRRSAARARRRRQLRLQRSRQPQPRTVSVQQAYAAVPAGRRRAAVRRAGRAGHGARVRAAAELRRAAGAVLAATCSRLPARSPRRR